jgi:hypothetical protein
MGVVYFTPQTMKRSNLSPELCKTGQITPSSGFGRWFCYSNSDCSDSAPTMQPLTKIAVMNIKLASTKSARYAALIIPENPFFFMAMSTFLQTREEN